MGRNIIIRPVWLIICHVFNVADAFFTLYAISKGVDEANPIMAWAIELSPTFFIVFKLALFTIAAEFLAKNRPKLLKWIATLLFFVILWHISFIFKI